MANFKAFSCVSGSELCGQRTPGAVGTTQTYLTVGRKTQKPFWERMKENLDADLTFPYMSLPTPAHACESCCGFRIMHFRARQTWVWKLASSPTSRADEAVMLGVPEPLFPNPWNRAMVFIHSCVFFFIPFYYLCLVEIFFSYSFCFRSKLLF